MIGTLRPRQAESLRRHGRTFAQTCRTLRAAAGLYFRKLPSIARYADLDAELVEILRRYNEILRRSRSGLPDSGISVDFTNLRSISTDFPNLENPPATLYFLCVHSFFLLYLRKPDGAECMQSAAGGSCVQSCDKSGLEGPMHELFTRHYSRPYFAGDGHMTTSMSSSWAMLKTL